jgi:hypothetical protein
LSVESITDLAHDLPMMTIKKLILSQNKLFGADGRGRHTVDDNQSGWNDLCDALPAAPLEELVVADIGMGVKGVTSLAKAMSAGAALAHLDCSQNDAITGKRSRDNDGAAPWIYGEQLDGWIAMCSSLSNSSITSLNFSACGLNPKSLTPLADAIKLMAVLKKVALSNNFLFGSKDKYGVTVHDIDADQSGWSALCDALPGSPVEDLDVADVGMGVTGVTSLAKAISSMAAIKSLTVDSTGSPKLDSIRYSRSTVEASGPRTYALTMGEAEIDLSNKNLSPADVTLLTAWIQRPEVSAALASLIISRNEGIGSTGADPLMDTIRTKQAAVSIHHDGCKIRDETCIFFAQWSKLSSWKADGAIADADEELARFAAEHGHPLLTEDNSPLFSTQPLTLNISIADMVQLLSGDEHRSDFEGGHLSVIEIAKSSKHSKALREWAVSFGTFLGRYHIDSGPPVHRSATCEVRFATDSRTSGRVALKLMKNRHQFEAEITGRRVTSGSILSAEMVVAVIGWHTPNDCMIESRQETSKVFFVVPSAESPYEYVLVMSCGERSLHDACAKERIAGYNVQAVIDAFLEICQCVKGLHLHRIVHGDLKQRNMLRMALDQHGNFRWSLCDMDAATQFKKPIGAKTSSAYAPPELARIRTATGQGWRGELRRADPSFDIWSLGVVLFELCTGRTLFSQDTSNDERICHETAI